MFFLLVTTILGGFQAFDIIHVMTEGGPVNATTTLIYYMYEEGFSASRAGRAAVSAMTLFCGDADFYPDSNALQRAFGELCLIVTNTFANPLRSAHAHVRAGRRGARE